MAHRAILQFQNSQSFSSQRKKSQGSSLDDTVPNEELTIDNELKKGAPFTTIQPDMSSQKRELNLGLMKANNQQYNILTQYESKLLKLKESQFKRFTKILKQIVKNNETQNSKLDNLSNLEIQIFQEVLSMFIKRKKEKRRELKIKLFANELQDKGNVTSIMTSSRPQKQMS